MALFSALKMRYTLRDKIASIVKFFFPFDSDILGLSRKDTQIVLMMGLVVSHVLSDFLVK